MEFTVYGQTPSKKNSKQIVRVRGRPMIIASKVFQQWHRDALESIKRPLAALERVQEVKLVIWGRDRRKWDVSNRAESVMDLLVDAGILSDDSYAVVPRLVAEYGGIDRDNPRCEVTITKVGEF